MRCCRASKSKPRSSSPPITQRFGNSAVAAATSSGKYRVSGRSLRLPSSTWSVSRKQIDRNPSHLGSYDASAGIVLTGLASIGDTGGSTGKSMGSLWRAACWNPDMAAAAEQLDVDGIAVRLSNPDKVYFPKLGSNGTKRRLVDYYLAVAAGPMLTSLRDPPTHLQRFPDGIDGEEIYQKRIPQHHPDYLQTCRVTLPSGRTADALKVTHPAAIVWAAQMGTVTLHPWQVRCPDTEHPDELRIDLDPQPGTGFAEARAVAADVLRPLLDELGLVGYPKTSGGRGVHVFLRIKTDWDFIQVRRAGIALAREVERRAPDAVTTSWWKEERGERIFIDFNQNARDRTFASAYSVRRTQIATVSMPLSWDALADANPDDYTMATVADLVARRDDPWADIDSNAQSIEPLLYMVRADEERGLGDMPYPPNYPKMPGEPKRVQPSRDTDLKSENKRG